MEKEIWKPVVGYEGFYEVSNIGRVRSLDRISPSFHKKFNVVRYFPVKGRILKQRVCPLGYCEVRLCRGGVLKAFSVHRLVAQAFIPNPDNLPQVNHIDENPSNNCDWNLEWCDCKYNINFGNRKVKMMYTRKKYNTYNGRCVVQYDLSGNYICEYKSIREANRKLGVSYTASGINKCCHGIRKTYMGYKWKFKEDV